MSTIPSPGLPDSEKPALQMPEGPDQLQNMLDTAREQGRQEGVNFTLDLIHRTVAHIIGNALAPAHGYAKLLIANPQVPESLKAMVSLISESTDSAVKGLNLIQKVIPGDLEHLDTTKSKDHPTIDLDKISERLHKQGSDTGEPTP